MVNYLRPWLDRTFAAQADPTRRRMIESLAQGERCVTDLARPHRMSRPAVSKHLRVLERAGLLRRRRHGRVHRLKLEIKPMKHAQQWKICVAERRDRHEGGWNDWIDRLQTFVETQKSQAAI